ncbi:copper amine oxidase [Epithele typhae]|uniref:copper amine oxidase n=1 Tax=Epithele typhae TaxID=378194 RepID=UPI0020073585|nr:copper amine oxidase [Epithele typhae]KAH9918725.1 copper amine oxidase [Epithele typhae]
MAPAGYQPLKTDPGSTAPSALHRAAIHPIPPAFPAPARYASEGAGPAEPLQKCPAGAPPAARPPAATNPFASLTVAETTAIHGWLHAPVRGLNLTAGDKAWMSDNWVYGIEAHRPAKADAVAYLDGARARRRRRVHAAIVEATETLFGGSVRGLPNDTLVGNAVAPFSFDGSFRRGWYVDFSGTDPETWKVLKVVYNHQVFDTIDEFMAAFKNGTLKRLPERPDQDADAGEWSTRKRPQVPAQRDLDHLPGPRSVSFGGLRFRVDRATQYVSWLGWGLYLGFDRDMGMSLWDIRFRGEGSSTRCVDGWLGRAAKNADPGLARGAAVAQEAIAQYAGNDPMQTTTAWLDRYFGMVSLSRGSGRLGARHDAGLRLPHEAVYLPATTHNFEGSITRERAVCVFEHDSARPITRHTGYMKGEFGATKGYQLVVRSISTVGNYDYLFDYIFQLDGTIEGYGTAIRETTMGSLHDHVINYKVDLDVAGQDNSLVYTHTDTEGGYSLVNKEASNRWGIPRGYAIHPGISPVHNTVVGSKRLLNNANWARYNLAVSKRKDTEPCSSAQWNMNLPGAPPVDFHRFFDGENLTQTDLVAWVNVGMHHLPQAEDAPNTRTNLAASSFFVTPLNYFDYDVSIESTNAILLTEPATPGAPWAFDDYGVAPAHCVPDAVPPFEYVGVRTFGLDGKAAPPKTAEEMRKSAELFHRIKVELWAEMLHGWRTVGKTSRVLEGL